MRIIIVGAEGDVGKAACNELGARHDIIKAGRSSGSVHVDLADRASVEAMYKKVGTVDAVISTAGDVHFGALNDFTEETFMIGLRNKVMGQVNLVRIGQDYLNAGGSFTLSTGILADHPVEMTTSAAMVNGGIHSFAKAVSLELKNGIRINVVSSGLVEDAIDKYEAYFPGHNPIPMTKVINGYVKSVEGKGTGEIIRMYDNC